MQSRTYRNSHSSEGYGKKYFQGYQKGYYFHQWENLEKPILQRILSDLSVNRVESALDFACGTGRILSVLEDYFSETIGVDVSYTMLEYARLMCPQSEIIHQDITVKPLDKTVGLVTAFRFFTNAEQSLQKGRTRGDL